MMFFNKRVYYYYFISKLCKAAIEEFTGQTWCDVAITQNLGYIREKIMVVDDTKLLAIMFSFLESM